MYRFGLGTALALLVVVFAALLGFMRLAPDAFSAEVRAPVLGLRAPAPQAEVASGQLELEGKFITQLTLGDPQQGELRQFSRPSSTVSLPAGRYRVLHVELKNGFSTNWRAHGSWFQVTPGQTCRLRIGAPLAPKITVSRWGRVLDLNCALVDGQGLEYRGSSRTDPPGLVIYQGDRKIGSGTFRYG